MGGKRVVRATRRNPPRYADYTGGRARRRLVEAGSPPSDSDGGPTVAPRVESEDGAASPPFHGFPDQQGVRDEDPGVALVGPRVECQECYVGHVHEDGVNITAPLRLLLSPDGAQQEVDQGEDLVPGRGEEQQDEPAGVQEDPPGNEQQEADQILGGGGDVADPVLGDGEVQQVGGVSEEGIQRLFQTIRQAQDEVAAVGLHAGGAVLGQDEVAADLAREQDEAADQVPIQQGGGEVAQDVVLPDTQDQPLPLVNSLPSSETVHSTFIPTIQWVPKSARAEFRRVLASLFNKIAYNPANVAGWILLAMFAKVILPAAPLRPDTSQARAVRDRLNRWRQGEYSALWREAIELTKKKKKKRAFIKKFADDTKCYQIVRTQEDRARFQEMLDNLATWSSDWQMLFNVDKCHVLHVGKKNPEF